MSRSRRLVSSPGSSIRRAAGLGQHCYRHKRITISKNNLLVGYHSELFCQIKNRSPKAPVGVRHSACDNAGHKVGSPPRVQGAIARTCQGPVEVCAVCLTRKSAPSRSISVHENSPLPAVEPCVTWEIHVTRGRGDPNDNEHPL